MRTTKTVWVFAAHGKGRTGGHSIEHTGYRNWIQHLQDKGFEIALHGVSDASSERERVLAGLEYFRDLLGHDPNVHSNHVGQKDGVHWGGDRFDPPFRWLYRAYRRSGADAYQGGNPASPYFWGDVCRSRIHYVRNMVFSDINTLKADPLMPYSDPARPFVCRWFSSSYGAKPEDFCNLISESNQDRLAAEQGACIVYTHFGDHFTPMGKRFRDLIHRLSRLPGWFVPASELLDYIGQQRGWCNAAEHQRLFTRMQWSWMIDQCARIGAGRAAARLETWRSQYDRLIRPESTSRRNAGQPPSCDIMSA